MGQTRARETRARPDSGHRGSFEADRWFGLTESDELTVEREIDHIIPIKYYDLNNAEDLYRCFNYKNTQLLHMKENRAKSTALPAMCK